MKSILSVCVPGKTFDRMEEMRMEVTTCRNCGKLFNHIRGQILCPSCQKELEGKFAEVKKYIYEHPNAGIHEVSKEMDVSVTQINHWIREERLCFAEGSEIGISCEKCGTSIRTGRSCARCKQELTNTFSEAAGLKKSVPNRREGSPLRTNDNRMRFLDK